MALEWCGWYAMASRRFPAGRPQESGCDCLLVGALQGRDDLAGGMLNPVEGCGQRLGLAVIELDVIAGGRAGAEPDGLADDDVTCSPNSDPPTLQFPPLNSHQTSREYVCPTFVPIARPAAPDPNPRGPRDPRARLRTGRQHVIFIAKPAKILFRQWRLDGDPSRRPRVCGVESNRVPPSFLLSLRKH